MGESAVVIGAGVIGSRVAQLLAERGDHVGVVSRRGAGPGGVTHIAADAADAEEMSRLAEGATVIYNCVNPPYHRWPADWPPIAASVLAAAERSGAVLVTLSNLYGYGPAAQSLGVGGYDAAHPMTEATPLAATGRKGRVRARVWQDALAAHQAGRVRAAEVRPADFVGPGAQSALGERVVGRIRQGKSVWVLGRADRPHTWSFTGDVAGMLVVAGTDSRAWGHAWHVPSNEPRSQREVVAGAPPPPPARAGRRIGRGPRQRDPLDHPARTGTRLAAAAGAARDRVPVPRRLRDGLLGRPGDVRPEADVLGRGRRRHDPRRLTAEEAIGTHFGEGLGDRRLRAAVPDAGLELAERLDGKDGAGVAFGQRDVHERHAVFQPEGGVPETVRAVAVQFGVDRADELLVRVGLVGLGPVADEVLRHG
jgi:nucleoside-diphosphate-sugar epimerase